MRSFSWWKFKRSKGKGMLRECSDYPLKNIQSCPLKDFEVQLCHYSLTMSDETQKWSPAGWLVSKWPFFSGFIRVFYNVIQHPLSWMFLHGCWFVLPACRHQWNSFCRLFSSFIKKKKKKRRRRAEEEQGDFGLSVSAQPGSMCADATAGDKKGTQRAAHGSVHPDVLTGAFSVVSGSQQRSRQRTFEFQQIHSVSYKFSDGGRTNRRTTCLFICLLVYMEPSSS